MISKVPEGWTCLWLHSSNRELFPRDFLFLGAQVSHKGIKATGKRGHTILLGLQTHQLLYQPYTVDAIPQISMSLTYTEPRSTHSRLHLLIQLGSLPRQPALEDSGIGTPLRLKPGSQDGHLYAY